jgi:stress response protein YsnF
MEQKLSPEEISQLQNIQKEQESLVQTFGQLEYQIQSLELNKEELVAKLENIKQQEIDLGKNLNEKYGNGTINLETGVFTKET